MFAQCDIELLLDCLIDVQKNLKGIILNKQSTCGKQLSVFLMIPFERHCHIMEEALRHEGISPTPGCLV